MPLLQLLSLVSWLILTANMQGKKSLTRSGGCSRTDPANAFLSQQNQGVENPNSLKAANLPPKRIERRFGRCDHDLRIYHLNMTDKSPTCAGRDHAPVATHSTSMLK